MASRRASPDPDNLGPLERSIAEHGGAVFGFLYAQLGDRHAAEDLLQEVFLRAWQARDKYQECGRERAYLIRIADRLLVDRSRRRHNQPETLEHKPEPLGDSGAVADPPTSMLAAERQRLVGEAMAQLTSGQRRVLLLRYFGDLTFREIADELGCPLNTALSHARRGLEALRTLLAGKVE